MASPRHGALLVRQEEDFLSFGGFEGPGVWLPDRERLTLRHARGRTNGLYHGK